MLHVVEAEGGISHTTSTNSKAYLVIPHMDGKYAGCLIIGKYPARSCTVPGYPCKRSTWSIVEEMNWTKSCQHETLALRVPDGKAFGKSAHLGI
jgi:hypothetical protein